MYFFHILSGLFFILTVIGCGKSESYVDIAKNFMNAKDNKEALKYCSKDLKKHIKNSSRKAPEQIKVTSQKHTKKTAQVGFSFIAQKRSHNVNVYLIYEDGGWKVDDLGMLFQKKEMRIKHTMKHTVNAMAEGIKKSLKEAFTPKMKKAIISRTVGQQEVRITELKLEKKYKFYFFYKQINPPYEHKVKMSGFKDKVYSYSSTMRTKVYPVANAEPLKGKEPTTTNIEFSLVRKATKKYASLLLEVPIRRENTLITCNKKGTFKGNEIVIGKIGLFKNADFRIFSNDKKAKQIQYGKEKGYIAANNNNKGWYTLVLQGSCSQASQLDLKKLKKNLLLYNPDEKSFEGKLQLFNKVSVVKNTVHWVLHGTLFNKRPRRVQLAYFPNSFYEDIKTCQFRNVDLQKTPLVIKKKGMRRKSLEKRREKILAQKDIGGTKIELLDIEKEIKYQVNFSYKSKKKFKGLLEVAGVSCKNLGYMTLGDIQYLYFTISPQSKNVPDKIKLILTLSDKNKKVPAKIFDFGEVAIKSFKMK